eukprot:gene29946-36168_t
MHPPLYRPHPQCEQFVLELVKCHEEHKIGKWFGSCNEAKSALDRCFKDEKEARRRENARQAREFDAIWEAHVNKKMEMEAAKIPSSNEKK